MSVTTYFYIALGGALGALSRSVLSTWVYERANSYFPWGTFAVNILGCYILGFVYMLGADKLAISSNIRIFLTVGFLGAFTTFSTFSLETFYIFKSGEIRVALLNILGSMVFGLIAVLLGISSAAYLGK